MLNVIDALDEVSQQHPPPSQEGSDHPLVKTSPEITISTQLSADQTVIIMIADNGPGIPLEIQAKIFEPFFTTKRVGKGTGLGLSVSYQVVTDLHGGSLECHSVPGQGTQFVITLPLRASQPTIAPLPPLSMLSGILPSSEITI